MQQPSKQECIQWLAQVVQDLIPHVPASARAGFQQQAQAVLQLLSASHKTEALPEVDNGN